MNRYIMYVDESGIGSLNDKRDKNFLVSALVIQEEEDAPLSSYFNYAKQKHKISAIEPFHSYDVFEDKQARSYLPPKKARLFVRSISELLNIGPIKFIILVANKDEVRSFYGIPSAYKFNLKTDREGFRELPYEILSRELFFWFAKFLSHKDALGSVVVESRNYSDYTVLQAFLDTQESLKFKPTSNEYKYAKEVKKRIHSLNFTTKKGLRGCLEIIDLVSFISYQNYLKRLNRFGKQGGRMLWNYIKEKIDKGKIQKMRNSGFRRLIPDARTRKLTNYIRWDLNQKKFSSLASPTIR